MHSQSYCREHTRNVFVMHYTVLFRVKMGQLKVLLSGPHNYNKTSSLAYKPLPLTSFIAVLLHLCGRLQ